MLKTISARHGSWTNQAKTFPISTSSGNPGGCGWYRDGSKLRTASAKRNSSFSHGVRGAVTMRETRTTAAPSASRHQPRTIARVGFIRALIVLHRIFGKRAPRDRIHILLRFLTSPMLRVLNAVPPNASLLDIGAGHGLFAALARGRRVVAVEPDARKVRPIDGVEFVIGFDDAIAGTFDAISIIDVLYKIPIDQWDALLLRCRKRLAPNGILIIKEQDPTARLKN